MIFPISNIPQTIKVTSLHTTAIITTQSMPIRPTMPMPTSSIQSTGVDQLAAVKIITIIATVAAPTIDAPIDIFAVVFQHTIDFLSKIFKILTLQAGIKMI